MSLPKPVMDLISKDEAEFDVLLLTALQAILVQLKRVTKCRRVRQKLCSSSLSGKAYVDRILEGPSTQLYELLRMEKSAFINLCDHFQLKGFLSTTNDVDVKEKMAIFLMTINSNCQNRFVEDQFQYSKEALNKYFREVLEAMLEFCREMVVPPAFDKLIEIRIRRRLGQDDTFKGAIGALDGTLISASNIQPEKQIPYKGKNGKCFQNLMAACDFDMKFIHLVAGWEGIASDSRVLNDQVHNPANKFPVPPPNMYYMCDAAYTHTKGYMCPYPNTRYSLKDFRHGSPPKGKKEMFNYAHAQLRNVIERAFGALKARFPILNDMPSCYSYTTQVHIVVACMAIHNFVRQVSPNDSVFQQYEDEDIEVNNRIPIYSESFEPLLLGPREQVAMINLRDKIANDLTSSTG